MTKVINSFHIQFITKKVGATIGFAQKLTKFNQAVFEKKPNTIGLSLSHGLICCFKNKVELTSPYNFDKKDVLGCYYDREQGKVWFTKNNSLLGQPFQDTSLIGLKLFPTIEFWKEGECLQLVDPNPVPEMPATSCKSTIFELRK